VNAITFGNTLRQWRGDGFVVTETLHAAGVRLPPHDHEAANITIVLRGGFDEQIERRSITAARGSVIVKPAGARHANHYGTSAVECITIEVPSSVRIDDARHFAAPPFALLAERLRTDRTAIDVEELVWRIAAPRTREPRAAWLATVEQLLREERVTSLAQLGAAVDRHPAHIAREFRAHYGCSVGEFVRASRIDAAAGELRDTNRPISDIALDSGFYDRAISPTSSAASSASPPSAIARNDLPRRPRRAVPKIGA